MKRLYAVKPENCLLERQMQQCEGLSWRETQENEDRQTHFVVAQSRNNGSLKPGERKMGEEKQRPKGSSRRHY